MSKYQAQIDAIREHRETLTQAYWEEHKKLATTCFASTSDQMDAAAKLGKLAGANKALMTAQTLLMDA